MTNGRRCVDSTWIVVSDGGLTGFAGIRTPLLIRAISGNSARISWRLVHAIPFRIFIPGRHLRAQRCRLLFAYFGELFHSSLIAVRLGSVEIIDEVFGTNLSHCDQDSTRSGETQSVFVAEFIYYIIQVTDPFRVR